MAESYERDGGIGSVVVPAEARLGGGGGGRLAGRGFASRLFVFTGTNSGRIASGVEPREASSFGPASGEKVGRTELDKERVELVQIRSHL